MALNRSSGLIPGLTAVVNRVKASILRKFKAFYLRRVHETDLAPTKTFSYDFELSTGGTAHRRSVSKLKALIIKNILKNSPGVALAEKEFLPVDGSNSNFYLNLFTIDIGKVMPKINDKVFQEQLRSNRLEPRAISDVTFTQVRDYERYSRSVIKSTVQYLQVERYIRYLQYLIRKHGIPLHLALHYDLSEITENVSLKYSVSVKVVFIGWVPSDQTAEQRFNAVQAGATDDGLFSDVRLWTSSASVNDNYNLQIVNFFTHLDKIVKVVNTFTRKIEYGYNAFSFRTA